MFGHLTLNMKDSSALHALIRAGKNMDTSFVHPGGGEGAGEKD